MSTLRFRSPRCQTRPVAGFTLVELLVTMGVFCVLSAGVLGFFVQSLNIYRFDGAKLRVNRDIRAFTSEMADHATFANYFLVFPDFATRSRTEQYQDAEGETQSVTVDASVNNGASGDMLVLVFTDVEATSKISRLIGYFRDASGDNNEGPVRTFDVSFSPSSNRPVWELIPASGTRANWPEVIELSKGLANGRLFYNFHDRSVMVKGQIIHRSGTGTEIHERATNTYNFTVSPRG